MEDEPALRTLGNLDCDSVQGYLLGRATAAGELPAIVEVWRDNPHSRTPRHFQQHVLPGFHGSGMQVTLLRALQNRSFQLVKSEATLSAATQRTD